MRARRFPALVLVSGLSLLACADASERKGFGAAGDGERTADARPPAACEEPTEGCPCPGNQPPVSCVPDHPPPELQPGQPELCYEGTRRCEDGTFGPCVDVRAYEKPAASASALVDQVSDHPNCSECDLNCFRVTDSFNPDDGPLDGFGNGLSFHGSGAGVTLTADLGASDAGVPDDAGLPTGSLLLEVGEGLVDTEVHQSLHRPEQADIYVLLDRSLTMAEEVVWVHDRFLGGDNYNVDGLPCTEGDQSLADGGISGGIRCMVRDPAFGTGMFRDIPFDPYATDQSLPVDQQDADARAEIAYRHHQNLSTDPATVPSAMGDFSGPESSGDPDVAGSHIPALYSIATGQGHFMGLDRSAVPDAVDCAAGTSGYPCFRDGSDAIVVLVSDTPMHNGADPATYPYDYDPAQLAMSIGTSTDATTIPSTNDDFTGPYHLSDSAESELRVYLGSTASLSPAIPAAAVSCDADPVAADATFTFTVASAGTSTIDISAQGTAFDSVLAIFDGPVAAPEVLAPVDDDNELFESAHPLGDVNDRDVVIDGDTTDPASASNMGADYQGSLFGDACDANSLAPDAVFSFDVASASAATEVELTLDMGGDFGVLAIYEEGAGPQPRWPAAVSPIAASGNTNAQAANVFDIPSGAGNEYVTITGNTSGLDSDYEAIELGGAACDPDSASKDAGFHISVNGTQSLRFDTEGSSFDTVLSLHRRPPLTKDGASLYFAAADTHQNLNEDAQTAWNVGPVDGLTQVYAGDTTGMSADVGDTFGCGMDSNCGDAVYQIQVLESTTVRFEVEGTGYEPAIVVTRADPAGVAGRYPPLALGARHTCAVSGGQVYCWGADEVGQLGDGGGAGDPDSPDAVLVSGLTDVLSVCAGQAHSCAVNESGQVHCWGEGADGRLGQGNPSDAFAPVQASDIGTGETLGPAVQVTCGDAHSCALLADGRIACWGSDSDGQVGDGNPTGGRNSPFLISSSDLFEQVAAGGAHTCAIRDSDNAVLCWGDGASGQLGHGANADADVPVEAVGLVGATHIMTGSLHTCAPLSSGRVMCWGRGAEGQLGQGSSDLGDHNAPVAVLNLDGTGLLANSKGGFAAGRAHSCVATLEGFVRCWGDNGSRQMGNDSTDANAPLPILVFDILDALTVVAGDDHSCALRGDGTVYCWGEGTNHRLGDGLTTTPSRPVRAHAHATDAVDFGSGSIDAAFTQGCHSVAQSPEDGCTYASNDGHGYFFCNDHQRTWAGAGQACEAVGMQLVDVDTAGENAFISSYVDDRAWIGVKRESSDDWSTLEENLHFEDLDGNRVWYTEEVGHDECFFFCRWEPTRGYFTSEADPDLVDSDPWTSASTWIGDDQPSPDWGHNCVTVDTGGHWETDNCTAVEEPSGGCGFLGLGCLFGFLGDLIGGIVGIFSDFLGDLLEAIFDSLGGVFVAPHFSGGMERDYICEERETWTEMTLDPGTYFVTVKGIDDGVADNACEGPYELSITDIGTPGGGFIDCDDNGVAETPSSVLETTLTNGDYYLVLKGKAVGDEGDYQLTVRDVGAVSTSEVACDASGGVGDPATVTIDADPTSTYYALVKGDAPTDMGPYTLTVRGPGSSGGGLIACDTDSGPDGDPALSLELGAGTYYGVLKGDAPAEDGPYRLTLGGATPGTATFSPPTYDDTIAALNAADIRVATIMSCVDSAGCSDAIAQGAELANDTSGIVLSTNSAGAVPSAIVHAVKLLEALDDVNAELLFTPDANPGFTSEAVTPVADPGNHCTNGMTGFTDCMPGASPAFTVSLQNPALSPVPLSSNALGAYEFTLRVTGTRDGEVELLEDIPVFVVPSGAPPAGTYTSGSYYQDFDSRGCDDSDGQRPSWDELLFDADVRPDTRIQFGACTATTMSDLGACTGNGVRVLTVTAGSGAGTACTAATQDTDCPDGYCSPYTGICNYLEGKSCSQDAECPGSEAGRCRTGPSAPDIGDTCRVYDVTGDPASALGSDNLEPYMRLSLDLESLGDGSVTPSVFFWETWYRCRNVE